MITQEDLDRLKMRLEYHQLESCSGHPFCTECWDMENEIDDLEEKFAKHGGE